MSYRQGISVRVQGTYLRRAFEHPRLEPLKNVLVGLGHAAFGDANRLRDFTHGQVFAVVEAENGPLGAAKPLIHGEQFGPQPLAYWLGGNNIGNTKPLASG